MEDQGQCHHPQLVVKLETIQLLVQSSNWSDIQNLNNRTEISKHWNEKK